MAYDDITGMLRGTSTMSERQLQAMIAATLPLASGFWQVSHPTPTLARLYEQVPSGGHIALDFEPRLKLSLRAMAVGLVETLPEDSDR